MIKYNLKCENDHEFESWFSNSQEFDKLNKKKLLECIFCSSNKIEKSIMAPMVSGFKEKESEEFLDKKFFKQRSRLLKLREHVEKNFELDYWGLSNKQALELILKNDQRDLIKIGSAGPISLDNSKKILSKNKRNRLLVSQNVDADYIINNYADWHGKYKKKRYIIP